MILAEALKFIGTAVATTAAIAAIYLDGIHSKEGRSLTSKGKLLVSLAGVGFCLSAAIQVVQVVGALDAAEDTRVRHEQTAMRLERISDEIARSSFPLEPVELDFSLKLSMDQPALKNYAERVQRDIVNYLRDVRPDPTSTSDDLAGEPLFMISNVEDWKPRPVDEQRALSILLEDATSFNFVTSDDLANYSEGDRRTSMGVRLLSAPPYYEDALVTMPRRGTTSQRIDVTADFAGRVFTKTVRVTNPLRVDDNAHLNSSVDLIGRQVTWSSTRNIDETLSRLAIRFSYDYGFRQNAYFGSGREIDLTAGGVVTANNIGLSEILP